MWVVVIYNDTRIVPATARTDCQPKLTGGAMAKYSDEEGAVLVEILGGNCTWENYKKKCGAYGLAPSRLLVCGMLRVTETHMEGEDVRDDSVVALTERGRELAERVRQVREIFCDPPAASTPPRRRHHKRIRQGELFPPTN